MTTISPSLLAKRQLYPVPTYVGEYSDGSRRRMSFWQAKGKAWECSPMRAFMRSRGDLVSGWIDPRGFAGRNSLPACGPQPGTPLCAQLKRAGLIRDDLDGVPMVKPKRDYKKTLAELLAWLDGEPLADDSVLERARDLVA